MGERKFTIYDLVKPAIRNRPVDIIVHAGCNDLSNNTNPLSNIKKRLQS